MLCQFVPVFAPQLPKLELVMTFAYVCVPAASIRFMRFSISILNGNSDGMLSGAKDNVN